MLEGVPLPQPDPDTQLFWDGCNEERFLVPRCVPCGKTRWPPGPMCPHCQSTATEWIESSGAGSVYSWVVVTHPVDPVFIDQVPYVVAMIDLAEGVRVVGNVEDCAPDEIVAGMAVELFFEQRDQHTKIPNFRRAWTAGPTTSPTGGP